MGRLTRDQVAELRRRYAAGEEYEGLAAEIGLSLIGARQAITGLTWGSVTDPPPVPIRRRQTGHLTAAQVAGMRAEAAAGVPVGDVCAAAGVPYAIGGPAIYGGTWAHLTDPPPVPRPDPEDAPPPPNARLTPERVADARRRYAAGTSISTLAAEYEVAAATARSAIHGMTWRGVTDPPPVPRQRAGGRRRYTDAQELGMLRDVRAGATTEDVAQEHGTTRATVHRIITRRRAECSASSADS